MYGHITQKLETFQKLLLDEVGYKEGKNNKPNIVAYADGPFYPDKTKTTKDAEQELRDQVYEAMVKRSKNSTFEYIKYVKKEESTK